MIIFELDNWTIESGIHDGISFGRNLTVRHACTEHMGGRKMIVPRVFVYPNSSTFCWRCTKIIPESIVALYLLHEWNNL